MKEITLTINGKKVKGREGNTVLEVCEANDCQQSSVVLEWC
jgi:NADH dehydrogenase/NADH:ubiquinone oxidoreductase subunit G